MCGIAGFIDTSRQKNRQELETIARLMADSLRHRGPDDGGVWADTETGIALGHRRLSILDLSPQGHQPMVSHCGRYVISFNGEIYNHREIRTELEDGCQKTDDRIGSRKDAEAQSSLPPSSILHPPSSSPTPWRGHSDTEVMLEAIARWGIEKALQRFNGMFAFAVWDRKERILTLARDRLGEKPLYYGWMGKTFLFGSELKALRAHPEFRAEINRDALALFFRHNYVPVPYSIYQNVWKLPAGTMLTSHPSPLTSHPALYWSVKGVAEEGLKNPFTDSAEDGIHQLDTLLRDAVKLRMEADVPLGAFLSGGIDSSTTVALMQAQSSRPVKTFSIGFDESGYNEAEHAGRVARHLGTEHTELYVKPQDAMAIIPRLPALYDEPFADSSQIPTFLVSELARRHVIVSLSGDGGDELFGGYPRFRICEDLWKKIGWLPSVAKRAIAGLIKSFPVQIFDRNSLWVEPVFRRYGGSGRLSDKLLRAADVLSAENPEAMYLRLISHWDETAKIVPGASEPPTIHTSSAHWPATSSLTNRMMFLDTVGYLPDDILVKVDRASMGVSLEARAPLLDHRVVEFAWRLPLAMKIRDGESKWILRRVLDRYAPRVLIERPKMGFGAPIGDWLRGPLREWAENLLEEGRLKNEGFLNPKPIREKWTEHFSGRRNWQYHLWDVLMFQAWLEASKTN